jgi:hypothetical protein
MNKSVVNAHSGSIVNETVSPPYSAGKACAVITTAIIYSAVKSNFRPPIAGVKQINTV